MLGGKFPAKPASGFTLLEVLIAVALFSLLATMSYSGLRSVIQTDNRLKESAEVYNRLQSTLLIMEQDFLQMQPVGTRDALGDPLPAVVFPDQRADFYFEFTRGGLADWSSPGVIRQQRIAYALSDKTLVRRSWRGNDYTDTVLLTNINGMTAQWYMDEWRSTAPLDNEKNLPRAIWLQFDLAQLGKLDKIFAVTL